MLGSFWSSAQRVVPGPEHRDRGIAFKQLWLVEHCEPALQGGHPAAAVVLKRERAHESRELVGIARGGQILDRELLLPLRQAPRRCSTAESRSAPRLAPLELRLEHFPQQMVVAEPAALVVEGDDEQVLALQALEDLRGVSPLDDRVAERGAHRLENGGPSQELELRRLHPIEGLGSEVVGDEAVGAAERPDGRAAAGQRECREVQTGRPAFRAHVQRFCLRLGHAGSRRRQERVRFGVVQRKLGGPELE